MTNKISVEGMSCGHCKMAVEKAALSVQDVERAEADLGKKELSLTFSGGRSEDTVLKEVISAIKEAGYSPSREI